MQMASEITFTVLMTLIIAASFSGAAVVLFGLRQWQKRHRFLHWALFSLFVSICVAAMKYFDLVTRGLM